MSSTSLFPWPPIPSSYNPPSTATLDRLSKNYFQDLRCKVMIYDSHDPNKILHRHDSFRAEGTTEYNDMILTYCDVGTGMSSTGTFTLQIEDPERNIDISKVHENCKVVIQAGKKIDNYKNLLYGFIDTFAPIRKGTGTLAYQLSGLGSGSILNDIIVDFVRNASITGPDISTPVPHDPNQRAFNLAGALMTATDIFPLVNQKSIADRIGCSIAAIDRRVSEYIPGINSRFVTAAQVANIIADVCGAIFGVDAYNQFFLRYPTSRHSGITIKDRIEEGDHPNYTSYPHGEWRWSRSIKKADGFANRLYAKTTSQSTTASTSQSATRSSKSLYQRDVGMQIIPGTAKFRDLALVLARKGNGGKNFLYGGMGVHGHIIEDYAGGPFGQSVAQFNIPMGALNLDSAKAIYTMNINFTSRAIDAFGVYWIVLYAHGDDENNTVIWFNDGSGPAKTITSGIKTTPPSNYINPNISQKGTGRTTPLQSAETPTAVGYDILDLRSAERSSLSTFEGGRGPDHTSTNAWYISNVGPMYAFGTFDSWSHLVVADDPQSIEDWGLKEDVVDVSWAPNASMANKYLQELLVYRAKPRINFQINQVSIPANFFEPGTLVNIVDEMSGLTKSVNMTAEIMDVRYQFDAYGDDPLGCRTCQITPLGYYKPWQGQ